MKDEKIPSLTDREWASKNELGSVTEVVEYSTGDGKKRVKVDVRLVSGEELDAIEAECAIYDKDDDTKVIDIDRDAFTKLKLSRMFGIEKETLEAILKNKSSDLRTRLLLLAARLSGDDLSEEEIEKEKNLESSVSQPTT